MSERYRNIIEEIKREYERPVDLKNEELIFGHRVVPVLFSAITFAEEEAYASKMLHIGPVSKFFQKASFKPSEESDIVWNLDEGRKGVFDEEGRFFLEESIQEPSSTLWFFQTKKNHVCGPLTYAEMKERARNDELENTVIKRNNDVVCVSFTKLKDLCLGSFNNEKDIEAVFLEEARLYEVQKRDQNVFSKIDRGEHPNKVFSESDMADILAKCNKSSDFLVRRNSKAGMADIERKLGRQDKNSCIRAISDITGMSRSDCETFIDILIEESKLPICCNVDKEGYEILMTKSQKSDTRGFC